MKAAYYENCAAAIERYEKKEAAGKIPGTLFQIGPVQPAWWRL
jgi:hypothetical protein